VRQVVISQLDGIIAQAVIFYERVLIEVDKSLSASGTDHSRYTHQKRGTLQLLVLSHRGHHVTFPENTLRSFADAIRLGVDGIETDVRLSADGLPILFHDRLAPDGQSVASLTRKTLSILVGYSIPTLDAAVEQFGEILWNIEIKTPEALQATLPILRRYQSSRRLLISSFWHNVVDEISQSVDVECGILVAHRPFNELPLETLLPNSNHIRNIVWDYEILDRRLVRAANEAGVRSWVYGADNFDEQQNCAEIGVDGLITDRPELLRRE